MRTLKSLIIVALLVSMGGVAFAELQNVEVGGKLRIRGNMFSLEDNDASFVEQRTMLNVKADFTNEVSAFIELDSYDIWGEDFRSNYLTGADGRAASGDDVEMYQAYINVKDMWGTPLSLRVGRQELVFGNEFVLGNNDTGAFFRGLSYDAVRLTFANDVVTADLFAGKLAETFGDFGEDDVDLYGLYASYIGIEDVVIDGYYLYVRDDVVDGSEIDISTIGLRGAGTLGAFDFDLEAAYQFGEIDGIDGACPIPGVSEADVEYDEFAINAEAGYTFDMAWTPRVSASFAYIGGGDWDESIWSNDMDMPFNRLFSDVEYSAFLDNADAALSNVFVYGLAVEAMPTECVSLKLMGNYYMADVIPDDCGWWFWKQSYDDELGWEVGLKASYNYSEDLVVRAGYSHFFGEDGLDDEGLVLNNGLGLWAGDEDDDYDYVFVETEICF